MGKIAVSKGGSSYITLNYPPEIVKQFAHPTRNQQSDAAAGDAMKAVSQAGDRRDFIIIIYLVCVCVCIAHTWRSRDSLWELVLFFCHVAPMDETKVLRPDVKPLI